MTKALPECPGSRKWAPGDPDQLGHGLCPQCGKSVHCNSSGIILGHGEKGQESA